MDYKKLWKEFYSIHFNSDGTRKTTKEEGSIIAFGEYCVYQYIEQNL